MKNNRQLIALLQRSRAKLLVKGGWIQRTSARNALGKKVSCRSKNATCFCAGGAVSGSSRSETLIRAAYYELFNSLPYPTRAKHGDPGNLFNGANNGIVSFNDSKRRKKAQVIALFSATIKRLKS